jgi:putative hydrolase of the HAD superfamily
MGKINTVSFDFWNTLVTANPKFAEARLKHICDNSTMVAEEIEIVLKKIKNDIDENVERHGVHYDSMHGYRMIVKHCDMVGTDPYILRERCRKLFVLHPPVLVEGAVSVLKNLKTREYKIFLSSNTVLIDGAVLDIALHKLGVFDYFDGRLYSDRLGHSKPSPEFFKKLHTEACAFKNQIIHVGDNSRTDCEGAEGYGMDTFWIDNNLSERSITSFYNKLITDKL